MRLVHSQSVIEHAIKMNCTSTVETLEKFWNPLSKCSEHQVGTLPILYSLVKVSSTGELLMVVKNAPRSLSVNYYACHRDHGLLEYCRDIWRFLDEFILVFWTPSPELRRSSTPWLRLIVLGIAHGSQQGALFTLRQLLCMPYRWITRVL